MFSELLFGEETETVDMKGLNSENKCCFAIGRAIQIKNKLYLIFQFLLSFFC